jgi:hypothetical protein
MESFKFDFYRECLAVAIEQRDIPHVVVWLRAATAAFIDNLTTARFAFWAESRPGREKVGLLWVSLTIDKLEVALLLNRYPFKRDWEPDHPTEVLERYRSYGIQLEGDMTGFMDSLARRLMTHVSALHSWIETLENIVSTTDAGYQQLEYAVAQYDQVVQLLQGFVNPDHYQII